MLSEGFFAVELSLPAVPFAVPDADPGEDCSEEELAEGLVLLVPGSTDFLLSRESFR